jgi:NitT/TauT family transport system substrate-binding protein
MNKKTLVVALIASFSLLVAALSYKPPYAAAGEEKRPIKIAASTWPGWSHVFLAKEKGLFKKNKVALELIHIHEHIDAQQPFLNGEVDGVFQCLTDTIIQNAEINSKVVYVSDYSSTGDVIIGKVDTLSSLKGKIIGIEGVNTF